MKITKNNLALTCAMVFFANANTAFADLVSDADAIFNWGEKIYPQLLTTPQTTQTLGPWFYRYYPQTAIYVGVNNQDNGVYILYSASSSAPIYVDSVADLMQHYNIVGAPVTNPNPPVSVPTTAPEPTPIPAPEVQQSQCDNAFAPIGISYIQDGNNMSITTGGQCVAFPTTDICLPQSPNAGGISVLKSLDVQTYQLNGISFVTPAMATLFEPQIKSYADVNTCVINAPQSFTALNLSLNGCFDVTALVGNFPSVKGLVTVSPPVTMQLQGNISIATVADCFKTNASLVTDAITHQIWDNKNGVFVLR